MLPLPPRASHTPALPGPRLARELLQVHSCPENRSRRVDHRILDHSRRGLVVVGKKGRN